MKHPYALAIVVRRRPPVSSHVGDRAIVHADGRMEGFIGGACSRDIVRKAALESLRTGEPRLVSIDPLTCASEGALEVYIEPELPQPYFAVAGLTPIAHALAQIAPKLGYSVVRFVLPEELPDVQPLPDVVVKSTADLDSYLGTADPVVAAASAGITATHGHYDEAVLAVFLKHGVGYVGLLAGKKRGLSVIELLAKQGVPEEQLRRVRYPAGLAIGAKQPADVAVSIFAQIIASRTPSAAPAERSTTTAVDPVCGMAVEIAESRDRAEFKGMLYYFCGSHCSAAFAAEPEQYAVMSSAP
jgi:xanthine dehydrogenase accessory factor